MDLFPQFMQITTFHFTEEILTFLFYIIIFLYLEPGIHSATLDMTSVANLGEHLSSHLSAPFINRNMFN
ncbi:hypothetical protein RIF29_37979 [Crotalaria pallida]|uniref:Uncharacterized protein n=1 Tax=Crotalaria pallida TaxID=3830 RepID=A0AAN9E3V3_CROPI